MAKAYKRNRYRKKKNVPLSQLIMVAVSLFIFTYFSYHLVYGEMGYFSMREVNADLEKVETEHKELKAKRIGLENRVKRLRSDSLDLDVLDERSRDILGYVKEDEVIIISK